MMAMPWRSPDGSDEVHTKSHRFFPEVHKMFTIVLSKRGKNSDVNAITIKSDRPLV
jgi:hypothetical protein